MLNQFSRTELLFGKAAMEKLEIPEWLYSVSAVWAVMSVRLWCGAAWAILTLSTMTRSA